MFSKHLCHDCRLPLPISVSCPKLDEMEIHFNTTNIVGDLKNLLEDPRFQTLRSLPRCSLNYLGVRRMPLTIDELGLEAVVNGMIDIFPSLAHCDNVPGDNLDWEELSERIADRNRILRLLGHRQ